MGTPACQKLALLVSFCKKLEGQRPWIILVYRNWWERGRGLQYFHISMILSPPSLDLGMGKMFQIETCCWVWKTLIQVSPPLDKWKGHAGTPLAFREMFFEHLNGTCSKNTPNWLVSLIFYLQMRKRKQRKLIMNSTLSGMRWLYLFIFFLFQLCFNG